MKFELVQPPSPERFLRAWLTWYRFFCARPLWLRSCVLPLLLAGMAVVLTWEPQRDLVANCWPVGAALLFSVLAWRWLQVEAKRRQMRQVLQEAAANTITWHITIDGDQLRYAVDCRATVLSIRETFVNLIATRTELLLLFASGEYLVLGAEDCPDPATFAALTRHLQELLPPARRHWFRY